MIFLGGGRGPRKIALGVGIALSSVLMLGGAQAAPTQSAPASSAPAKAAPAAPGKSGLLEFGSSKEPIRIDSDRLEVFEKESRAVFIGNVVAVQGESTMRCTMMRVFYDQKSEAAAGRAGAKPVPGPVGGAGLAGNTSIRRIECDGPVTIVSKTQTGTGDRAEYDRGANKVYLIGNAALADGPNVTRGERVAYDLTTGVANIEGGRVRALIVPKSAEAEPAKDDKAAAPGKPKAR